MLTFFRKRWQWLCAAIALSAVLWFILASPSFQECVCQAASNQTNQAPDKGETFVLVPYAVCLGQFLETHGGTIAALATLLIAFFTFTLWRSTDKLWKESKAAGVTAAIIASAAKESADAAKKSADVAERTLIDLERPHLFFVPIEHNLREITRGEPAAEKIGLDIRYKIVNYGRSPAIITAFESGVAISPEFSDWNAHSRMSDITKVIAGNGGEMSIVDRGIVSQGEPHIRDALRGDNGQRAWLVGRLVYSDILGKTYRMGFCFWPDVFGRLNDGPPERNYRD